MDKHDRSRAVNKRKTNKKKSSTASGKRINVAKILEKKRAENESLKTELHETRELLHAIQSGQVDAIMVSEQGRQKVYTLEGAEHPYRVVIETMTEGTATLSYDGTVLYCNNRLAEILGTPEEEIIGGSLNRFMTGQQLLEFKRILNAARTKVARGELVLKLQNNSEIPVLMSLAPLEDTVKGICAVITDIRELKNAQTSLSKLNKSLQNTVETLQEEVTERLAAEESLRASQQELSSMASELSLIEQRERRRISLLLHDHIGQLLAVIKIKLAAVKKAAVGESAKLAEEILWLLDEAIKSTRSLTVDLSPPSLYTLGLKAALEEICEQFSTEYGIACSIEDDGKRKVLAEDIRGVLFRSVQELLANVAKHANATKVRIFFSRPDDHIEIKVRDNGIGFDPSKLAPQKVTETGLGLMTIRERISHLGGSLKIESVKGKGTTVTLTAPIQKVA